MSTEEKTESVAELEAKLALAKEKERIDREGKRKDYETLKTDTIVSLSSRAVRISRILASFKLRAFDDMQTLYSLLQDYSSRHSDGKGNFRIEFEDFRISYKKQGKASFDERSHQAEKHIIEFVNNKFEGDIDTRDLIMSLLERKKGELDIQLVQKLYAMENRFNDDNWKLGIGLLKESYRYSHSKDYIKFEVRDEKGVWQNLNLNFSSL